MADDDVANYRKTLLRKREQLHILKQQFSRLAEVEHDEFKRMMEERISQYAAVMEDIFANIETTVMVNDSLQVKIEGLRDIVWEIDEVKKSPVIQEKIRKLFRDYQARF
jgi:regulator of replication initiation timing